MTNLIDDELDDPSGPLKPVKNDNAILVTGILSIVLASGIGFILGAVALVLSVESMKLYKRNRKAYIPSSYKKFTAGYICAIIGVILSSLSLYTTITGFSVLPY